jgi:hypothetical protein
MAVVVILDAIQFIYNYFTKSSTISEKLCYNITTDKRDWGTDAGEISPDKPTVYS